MIMDIIRGLSSANLDIRKKTLDITLSLVVRVGVRDRVRDRVRCSPGARHYALARGAEP